jgi:hypothetical protein
VRRGLPWALIGLLALSTAAGAVLGSLDRPSGTSAQAQVAQIINRTRKAQTARFTYASVTSSSNSQLRSTTFGTGVVDFTTDSMSASERDRSTGYSGVTTASEHPVTQNTVNDEIWIGDTEYQRLPTGANALGSFWIKQASWPADSFGALGQLGVISPLGTLSEDGSAQDLVIRDNGHETVGGVEATEYLLVLPTCAAVTRSRGVGESSSPLEVWVDSSGRLIQARYSIHEDISKIAFLGAPPLPRGIPTGSVTVVDTVHLHAFGAPVMITAPQVRTIGVSGGGGFVTAKRSGCPL